MHSSDFFQELVARTWKRFEPEDIGIDPKILKGLVGIIISASALTIQEYEAMVYEQSLSE